MIITQRKLSLLSLSSSSSSSSRIFFFMKCVKEMNDDQRKTCNIRSTCFHFFLITYKDYQDNIVKGKYEVQEYFERRCMP